MWVMKLESSNLGRCITWMLKEWNNLVPSFALKVYPVSQEIGEAGFGLDFRLIFAEVN